MSVIYYHKWISLFAVELQLLMLNLFVQDLVDVHGNGHKKLQRLMTSFHLQFWTKKFNVSATYFNSPLLSNLRYPPLEKFHSTNEKINYKSFNRQQLKDISIGDLSFDHLSLEWFANIYSSISKKNGSRLHYLKLKSPMSFNFMSLIKIHHIVKLKILRVTSRSQTSQMCQYKKISLISFQNRHDEDI